MTTNKLMSRCATVNGRLSIVALLGLMSGLASYANAEQKLPPGANPNSITIVSVTPASGVFPVLPTMATATIKYNLVSAVAGQIQVLPVLQLQLGPGQVSPSPSVSPVWINKGAGTATVSFGLGCSQGCVPSGQVIGIKASLAQTPAYAQGPVGQVLVETTAPKSYTFSCPQPKPDITTTKGVNIAGKVGLWNKGQTLALTETEALSKVGGKCQFFLAYQMTNLGPVATTPTFTNRLRNDMAEIGVDSGQSLNPTESKTLTRNLWLLPGSHAIDLRLDADHQVDESNEGNNEFRIQYSLAGACGGRVQPTVPVIR